MRVSCSTRREPNPNTAGLLVCNLLVRVRRNKESSAVVRLEGRTGQGEPHGRPACGVGTPVRCRGASLSNMDSRSRWLSFALYGLAYPTSQWSLRFSDQIRMVHRSGQREFFRDACKPATCRCGWMYVVTGSGGVRAEQRLDHSAASKSSEACASQISELPLVHRFRSALCLLPVGRTRSTTYKYNTTGTEGTVDVSVRE